MLQEKLLDSVKILSVDYDSLLSALEKISCKIKITRGDVSKILLFGSFATLNYTPESDVDILIILKDSRKNFIERSDEFIPYFREIPFDVNILVYTEEEIKEMQNEENEFIKEVLRNGKEM